MIIDILTRYVVLLPLYRSLKMTAKSKILAKNVVKKLAIILAPFDYISRWACVPAWHRKVACDWILERAYSWACRKSNILNRKKRKCLLRVKRCIALLLPRAWTLTVNQRMNATVTVISSPILQQRGQKFMRLPWNRINYTTMHETCLKATFQTH